MKSVSNKPTAIKYRLCPKCFRAVPAEAVERYCTNDGEPMLIACPDCNAAIVSPYARHCGRCGREFARAAATREVARQD